MTKDISRIMTDLHFVWRWWLSGAFGNRTMISDFVLWYNDPWSERKLYATYRNSIPNTVLHKSCLYSVAEYIFFMIEEYRGRYFSNYVRLGCHGSKLFLCIPERNDAFWYIRLSWINDLNCFSSSSIIADMIAYVSFGKSVDESLILQIISFLGTNRFSDQAWYNIFMSLENLPRKLEESSWWLLLFSV